jgi:hypothetical protein
MKLFRKDQNQDSVFTSTVLLSDYVNMGIGSKSKLILFEKLPNIKIFLASIDKNNHRSQKSVLKAGYKKVFSDTEEYLRNNGKLNDDMDRFEIYNPYYNIR